MRVLISGAGIAGLTLAHCLHRAGIECTIVEKSPSLRSEGYMIDFFGSGYDAAERLGLLPELAQIHYPIDRLAFLTPSGREKYSIPYKQVRRLFDGRHFNFLRGDLEHVLHSTIQGLVEIRRGVVVESVQQEHGGVRVRLSNGSVVEPDLLVGADGIHSNVRALCFGEEDAYTRYLNCKTAAFIIDSPPSSLTTAADPNAFTMLTVPHRQVAVYPIRGGRLATFFVHRSATPPAHPSTAAAITELNAQYGNLGWIVPELLSHIDPATLYFDAVSQIIMPRWSSGRVALVGDAAYCVSLLAGQGASLATAGASVLAEEIVRAGADVTRAVETYERRLRPAIEKKQVAGRSMADWFLPSTYLRLALRDAVMRLSALPAARFLVKRAVAPESIFARDAKAV